MHCKSRSDLCIADVTVPVIYAFKLSEFNNLERKIRYIGNNFFSEEIKACYLCCILVHRTCILAGCDACIATGVRVFAHIFLNHYWYCSCTLCFFSPGEGTMSGNTEDAEETLAQNVGVLIIYFGLAFAAISLLLVSV